MTGANRAESIRTLYSENSQLARANLESRHKVLTNFLIAMGGIFVLLRWMATVASLKSLSFLPVAIAGGYSIVCGVMAIINGRLLTDGWIVGERLERDLDPEGGFFARSNQTFSTKRLSFNAVLTWLYFGTGFILIVVAVVLALIRIRS